MESDFERIAGYLIKAVAISKRIQDASGKKLVDFIAAIETDEEAKTVGDEIKAWARTFSIPGV